MKDSKLETIISVFARKLDVPWVLEAGGGGIKRGSKGVWKGWGALASKGVYQHQRGCTSIKKGVHQDPCPTIYPTST